VVDLGGGHTYHTVPAVFSLSAPFIKGVEMVLTYTPHLPLSRKGRGVDRSLFRQSVNAA
jgi:hypothetical protein